MAPSIRSITEQVGNTGQTQNEDALLLGNELADNLCGLELHGIAVVVCLITPPLVDGSEILVAG